MTGATAVFALAHQRVARAAARLGVELVVVAPEARGTSLAAHVLVQRGATFGERLAAAFADAAALGYRQIVAVGGDAPELGEAELAAAFRALAAHRVVLGPARDGGVYLLGVAGDASELLGGVPWQTRRVLSALLRRAPEAAMLRALTDLDRREDLLQLALDARRDRVLAAVLSRVVGGFDGVAAGRVTQAAGARLVFACRGPPVHLAA